MFARREPEEKVPCMNVKRFVDHEMSVGEARVARTYPSLLYDPKILIQFSKLFLHSTCPGRLQFGNFLSKLF
jgi:hypothetical protein